MKNFKIALRFLGLLFTGCIVAMLSVLSHAHAAHLLVFTLESGSVVEATIPDSSECPARIYSTTKFYPAPDQGSQTNVDFLDLADVKSVLYGQRLQKWHSMRIVMRDGREYLSAHTFTLSFLKTGDFGSTCWKPANGDSNAYFRVDQGQLVYADMHTAEIKGGWRPNLIKIDIYPNRAGFVSDSKKQEQERQLEANRQQK